MERIRFPNCHCQSLQFRPETPFPETAPVSLPHLIALPPLFNDHRTEIPILFLSSGGTQKSDNGGNGSIRRAASITTSTPC
jgi:hypothetical protein